MQPTVTDHGVRFVPDFRITTDTGSLFLVKATTAAGRDWIEENVDLEEAVWFGPHLVVEHSYIEALFDGMVDSGLVVR